MKLILPLLLGLWFPFAALADGVVIPSTAYSTKVTIPDQRALICWSNGVERLAIETHFSGMGTNFAWVVPLPSQPHIETATAGLFNTLEYIFRPKVVHRVDSLYAVILACTGIAYLMLNVRRDTPPLISDMLVSIGVALLVIYLEPFIGILLLFLLPYTVWGVRRDRESIWAILVASFIALLLGSMLMPALSTAGGGGAGREITIIGHEIIGDYDTTTVSARDPQVLENWLINNGYSVPKSLTPAISNYVSRGWVFVATKLRRASESKQLSTPQPLCFTFQTPKAIYPMQLTGIQNTNLTVDLFVFGEAMAQATHFMVERCATPLFPENRYFSNGSTERLQIVHPLLRSWVSGYAVATKLSATLTREMMTEDIELQWQPFKEVHQTIYSYQGAGIMGLNYGVEAFAALWALFATVTAIINRWRPCLPFLAILSLGIGIVVASFVFFSLPKTAVRLVHRPARKSEIALYQLQRLYKDEVETKHVISLFEARLILARIHKQNPELVQTNFLMGGPVREEDSPGNYGLVQDVNDVKFVIYDSDGGDHDPDQDQWRKPRKQH